MCPRPDGECWSDDMAACELTPSHCTPWALAGGGHPGLTTPSQNAGQREEAEDGGAAPDRSHDWEGTACMYANGDAEWCAEYG